MKNLKSYFKVYKPGSSGLCHNFFPALILFISSLCMVACGNEPAIPTPDPDPIEDTTTTTSGVIILDEDDIQDYDKFYKPSEFKNMDMLRSDSKWSFVRSKQSTHFIVFWEAGFGTNPNADTVPQALRVDIDDLLEKAEEFYDTNVNTLGFAEVGAGKSNLDKYKMEIYLLYQPEWLATGSGYDDMIGALWVNPSTCQPVGSTIAHEIGHSFQYQVYSDLLAYSGISNDFTRGFRYGFGGNGGNAFWEQCAQWQSFQNYPAEAFESYNFGVHMDNYHRHFCHEWHRYASYWLHYYWTDKHGVDFIGKLWREAEGPEDPLQAYMRINGLSVDEFNSEMYEAATRFVTWDLDAIRSHGSNYIGKFSYKFYQLEDGNYQVAYSKCPGSTGYNVIPLNVPDAGTVVTTTFTALTPGSALAPGDPGQYTNSETTLTTNSYNSSLLTRAGWRYGYVALLSDGQRVYGEMNRKTASDVDFTIPEGCEKLWFVVLGAPSSYVAHPWDEKESNDDQWPYKVKFANTDLYGNVSFDGSETPKDITLTYDISFPFSSDAYSGATVELGDDVIQLAKSFVLQPSEISSAMGDKIKFYAVEADENLNDNTTANGYGHWFDADGNVCAWGTDARVFSEFSETNFIFSIGQYPGQCASGDEYIVKQALVYEYEPGNFVQATLVFDITIQ